MQAIAPTLTDYIALPLKSQCSSLLVLILTCRSGDIGTLHPAKALVGLRRGRKLEGRKSSPLRPPVQGLGVFTHTESFEHLYY